MAFSTLQKAQIRFFLGYPMGYRDHNPRLENAFNVVGSEPESQSIVEIILDKLNALYGDGITSSPLDQQVAFAGIVKVESADDVVQFGSGNGNSANAVSEGQSIAGRKLVSALSSFFGVPIASDVFGTGGYVGDGWKFGNGMSRNFLMGS